MPNETLEYLAEIHGEDLDEIKDRLTSVEPEKFREDAVDYLEGLVGHVEDGDMWELTRHSRAEAADMNTGTYKRREREALNFCDWYDDYGRNNIDKDTIEDYLRDKKAEGYAENTLEARYWALIAFLKEGVNDTIETEARNADRKRIIEDDDEEKHDRKSKGARPITEEEKEKMAEQAPSLRLELMVRICWQCGLRAKELAELRIENIELDEKELTVNTAKRDDDSQRTLFYNLKLKHLLDKWINGGYRDKYTQAANSDYLLPTHKSDHPYPRNLTRAIRNLAEDAGVQTYSFDHAQDNGNRAEITVHSFRKAFGIRRIKNGASVREVQLLLGHSVMSTTQDYLELDIEDLRESDEKYRG